MLKKTAVIFRSRVTMAVLAGLALATSACTATDGTYKARDKDPNAGGGSMYRATGPAGAH